MSHRMYLYNLSKVGEQHHDDLMMMEWKYEFPLFFHPLFINAPSINTPVYNGDEGGLYANAKEGIEAIKQLYGFIETHKDQLIDNAEAFEIAKEKIVSFLDGKANKAYFHLDAWDVFNMSDESHLEQAQDLLQEISITNSIIQNAIEAGNPNLLDSISLFTDKFSVFKNFRDFINHEVYDYGWAVIESGYFPEENETIVQFEENSLWGLKDQEGNVLVKPQYTEMFDFDDNSGWAVVNRDNKFGYINRLGQEVIECKFDDAYDFDVNFAQVGLNGKRGLINKQGEIVVDCLYEDSHYLAPVGKYWAMKLNGFWGIIDNKGEIKLDFQYEKLDDSGYYEADFFKALKPGATKEIYLSKEFYPLGEYDAEDVTPISHNDSDFYIIKEGEGKDKAFGLKDSKGHELLPAKYAKIEYDYILAAFLVREGKKAGIYKAEQGFLLNCEHDKVMPVTQYNSTQANGGYALVKKGKFFGLYYTGNNAGWRITPDKYEIIAWLKNNYFSFKQDGLWGVIRNDNKIMVAAEFESLSSKMGYIESAISIGFKENKAFIIENDGTVRPLTQSEAESEIKYPDIAAHYYTEAEIEILQNNSGPLRRSEAIFDQGWDANNAGDFAKAMSLYETAAEMGNAGAMNNIGYIYEFEEAFKDEQKAFSWYTKGANAGSADAMNNLAECYKNGTGTAIDYKKAKYWYNLAINNGNNMALKNLAYYYYNGTNDEADEERTMELLLRAYKAGYTEMATPLGWTYESRGDFNNAFRYYLEDAGHYEYAARRVGEFYSLGLGCNENINKAIEYYNKAISFEDKESYLALARIYFSHPEVKNEAKAREFLKEALAAEVEGAKELAAENKKGFFGRLF